MRHKHDDLASRIRALGMGGKITLDMVAALAEEVHGHDLQLGLAREFAEVSTQAQVELVKTAQLQRLLLASYHDRLMLAEEEMRLLMKKVEEQDTRLKCVEDRTACHVSDVHNGQEEAAHAESQ